VRAYFPNPPLPVGLNIQLRTGRDTQWRLRTLRGESKEPITSRIGIQRMTAVPEAVETDQKFVSTKNQERLRVWWNAGARNFSSAHNFSSSEQRRIFSGQAPGLLRG
jgi:hypothetical protein